MKFTRLFLFVLILAIGCSGAKYYIYNVKVDKVYIFEDIPKNKIYNKTLKWISLNTNWSKSVIDYQDSSAATIVLKVRIEAYRNDRPFIVQCVFDINIKDNKMNVIIENNSDENVDKEDRKGFKDDLESYADDLAAYVKKDIDF